MSDNFFHKPVLENDAIRAITRSLKLLSKLNKKLMANRFLVVTEMNLQQREPT